MPCGRPLIWECPSCWSLRPLAWWNDTFSSLLDLYNEKVCDILIIHFFKEFLLCSSLNSQMWEFNELHLKVLTHMQ
jgi:hypothetical protein